MTVGGTSFPAFLEAKADGDVLLFGVPLDLTTSFRPGTRFGPQAIRAASEVLETFSPYLRRDLRELSYADVGDLPLPHGARDRSLASIRAFGETVYRRGKYPFALGGEHLITLPLVEAAHTAFPDLCVLHVDAHADARSVYEGEELSHATVIRRIAERIGPERVFSLAIRSGDGEEWAWAEEHLVFRPFVFREAIEDLADRLASCPVYFTLDIDVFDPSFAPGTGTPEPGGITPKEFFSGVEHLYRAGVRLIGADLVEVSPVYDTGITAVLAAKAVRELLFLFFPGGDDRRRGM
ncbi:MAG: agmatinase [Brockia lithotrophica]|nr:agmatinase [Brockia lithotrophica]